MSIKKKLLTRISEITFLASIALISGCGGSTLNSYTAVKPYIVNCVGAYFHFEEMVCVRNIPSHAIGKNGEKASDVPASAITNGMDKITSIDANSPYYDEIVAAAQKSIKDTGSAWVLIDYGTPNAYFLSFENHPDRRALKVYSAPTKEGTKHKQQTEIAY